MLLSRKQTKDSQTNRSAEEHEREVRPDAIIVQGIVAAIDRLATESFAGGVLKGEFAGLRRLRVGSYRVVYEVSEGELLILVIRIGHCREIYRSKPQVL